MKRTAIDNTIFSLLIVGFLIAVLPVRYTQAGPPASAAYASLPAVSFPDVEAVASYAIEVTLEPETRLLTGRERIKYTNTTAVPMPDLVFHLYLNAFRSLDTHFLRGSDGMHRMNSWDPDYPGWMEVSSLRLSTGEILSLELLGDGTLARASLPAPILPGAAVEVEVEFQALLPRVFARSGFAEDARGDLFFMVGQWFPKLGVWQETGWNAYPYFPNGEFFADFGEYDVAITLPHAYVTAGTGIPVEENSNPDGTRTVQYHASGVIDFAWAASPNFRIATRKVDGIEVVYVYLPEHDWTVTRVLDAAERALLSFGSWFGQYPYPRLTIVDVPDAGQGAGGMEYPTLVTAGVPDSLGLGPTPARLGLDQTLELVVIHEVGHQWWQSMVAFNEVEEPWLDEGFTEYSTARVYLTGAAPSRSILNLAGIEIDPLQLRRSEYIIYPGVRSYGAAWEFEGMIDYGIAAYSKPLLSLTTLENILGAETMLAVMETFFQRYQFAHPTTEDFKTTAEEISGQNLDWFFDGLVYGSGAVNYVVSELGEDWVRVVRQGDLVVPTEVLITFASGEQVLEPWDGVESERVFSYPDRPPIQSAWIDPERKILVDMIWLDNGFSRLPESNAWMALVTRIWTGLQGWILTLGGL
jgi:hypothetical protein